MNFSLPQSPLSIPEGEGEPITFPMFFAIPPLFPSFGRVVYTVGTTQVTVDGDKLGVTPMEGTVTFTPTVPITRWVGRENPITTVAQRIVAPIIDGELRPPGWDPLVDDPDEEPGVLLMADTLVGAQPSTMQWTASFDFKNALATPKSITFGVPELGIVDLTDVLPVEKEPGIIKVTELSGVLRAEQAALAAEDYAQQVSIDSYFVHTNAEYVESMINQLQDTILGVIDGA